MELLIEILSLRIYLSTVIQPNPMLKLQISPSAKSLALIKLPLNALVTNSFLSCLICKGTITYAAPEILTCNKYSKNVDIWSIGRIFIQSFIYIIIGVITYLILTGTLPFLGPDNNTIGEFVFIKKNYV